MLKKSVTLPALRAIAANMRSRQCAIPSRLIPGTIFSRDRKYDDLHRLDLQPCGRAQLERGADVGLLHESVARATRQQSSAKMLAGDSVVRLHPRHVAKFDGQENIVLVQDLVVLEAVQQRVRRRIGRRRSGTQRCPARDAAGVGRANSGSRPAAATNRAAARAGVRDRAAMSP